MYFYKFLLLNLVFSFISCVHSNDKEKKSIPYKNINIQKEFDKITENNGLEFGISGISFTMQCPKYQLGEAITFNSGLQKKDGLPMSNYSLFQIGSNSKSFVAVVILQLEKEGKLFLHDKVGAYFPNEYHKWQEISINQLLNMTSGIKTYIGTGNDMITGLIFSNPLYQFKTDEILDFVKDEKVNFPPGTKWEYSNTNTILLGKIIEHITKNTLSNEIQKRILNPLQMNHTYYIKHLPKNDIPQYEHVNLMSGYFYFEKGLSVSFLNGYDTIDFSMSSANAAGSITANTWDINLYIRELFSEKPDSILSQNQFHKMISMVDTKNGEQISAGVNSDNQLGYGYALFSKYNHLFNDKEYYHGGGTFGFLSKMSYFYKNKISYVVEINTDNKLKFSEIDKLVQSFIYQKCF